MSQYSIYTYSEHFDLLSKLLEQDISFILLGNGKCVQIKYQDGTPNLDMLERLVSSEVTDTLLADIHDHLIIEDKLYTLSQSLTGIATCKDIKEQISANTYSVITTPVLNRFIESYHTNPAEGVTKLNTTDLDALQSSRTLADVRNHTLLEECTASSIVIFALATLISCLLTKGLSGTDLVIILLASVILGTLTGIGFYKQNKTYNQNYTTLLLTDSKIDPASTLLDLLYYNLDTVKPNQQ